IVLASLASVAIVSTALAQNTVVTGRVRSAARKEPLPQASVFVDESDARQLTDSAGVFHLTNLRPGKHELRVRRLGFEPFTKTIDVPAAGLPDYLVELVALPQLLKE